MNDTIFREYDIRGKVASELVIDEIYTLTCAIAYYFKQKASHVKTIVVGMDGRIHSLAIKQEMCRALMDSGIDVIFIGVCTSPALYFTLHTMPVHGGLMITASHNGQEYNGIKICLGSRSVWGREIQAIRDLYIQKKRIEAQVKGSLTDYSIIEPYTDWLVDHFKHLQGMDLPIIIDCGNGAAGTVMPQLLQKMNWLHVKLLYPEVDGTYPHHEADPTVEKNMACVKKLLATTDYIVGMGLDGDCDRMAAMTKAGFLVPGDQLLAVFAQYILKDNPGAKIVFDIKSSAGLSEIVQESGGVAIMSPSGHAIIKEYMKKNDALLGGELSCHFFFKDRYFGYDDGVYALLRLIELLCETASSLEKLIAVFPQKYSSPEFRIFCEDVKKHFVVEAVKNELIKRPGVELITIDGVHASMAYGWGIVRVSNTQPALSIRFEGHNTCGLQQVKDDFIDVLQPFMPELNLTDTFNA
ncbi:MAG: phosphomannomutase/phosphoglucomutase [Candidatus Dependentiae bacterium]|nr:phosphomannomutase/phosphoglucomutase [Candidatus Dependentiae bacterium]